MDGTALKFPPMLSGHLVTTESFDLRYPEFKKLQSRLSSINSSAGPSVSRWATEVVKAEMNGYDFNYRILKPWQRDPAFYASIFMGVAVYLRMKILTARALDIWKYTFPLRPEASSS
ncbi:MAG: hypothetical protein IPP42_02105 [Saprospiraceae bacterium]|nr:hypothetical protein [Saprospiraceae bacterium]